MTHEEKKHVTTFTIKHTEGVIRVQGDDGKSGVS